MTMATLKIPAAYLDDARQALAIEMTLNSECLRDGDAPDRTSNVEIMRRDMRLLEQLDAAHGDVEVDAPDDITSSPIEHMLDQVVRIVAGRLSEAKEYGPVPMGEVLALADELRWAASEAIRITPSSAVL